MTTEELLAEISAKISGLDTLLNHPAMTTPFSDYTVTEGLLLLLFLFLYMKLLWQIVKEVF